MPKTIRTNCSSLVPFPHDPNQVYTGVPDAMAALIVRLGNGEIIKDEGADPAPEPNPIARIAEEYAPVLTAGPEGRDEDAESALSSQGSEDGEPLKRPYGNASKAAWIAYALSVDPDLTEEAAKAMSKNQLTGTYGERL